MSILHNIFFFIVAIGVLVTFHEFGHYWVARKAGVKVLRFSVGFGRPLYTWRRNVDGDDIEYVIAAIPFGGYVKMLDEREGEVADEARARAFNNQSVLKRSLIVFAGPAFNFILAVILYWVVFMIGSTVDRPLVGELDAEHFGRGYGEENDFCQRAIAAGWRNVIAADVFVRLFEPTAISAVGLFFNVGFIRGCPKGTFRKARFKRRRIARHERRDLVLECLAFFDGCFFRFLKYFLV